MHFFEFLSIIVTFQKFSVPSVENNGGVTTPGQNTSITMAVPISLEDNLYYNI